MLFGVLSIIMDIFKIVSYVGYVHCESAIKVAFPVVQLVFIIAQVFHNTPLLLFSSTQNAVS